jgi:hypothetical protein
VVDPADYGWVAEALRGGGRRRRGWCWPPAFAHTAAHAAIAAYLSSIDERAAARDAVPVRKAAGHAGGRGAA